MRGLLLLGLPLVLGTLLTSALTSTPAQGAPRWADADSATIHPGVQMITADALCTGNFVFTDAAGAVYVGYAAHCAGTGGSFDTDGCTTGSRPLGSAVRFVTGQSTLTAGRTVGRGTLAYSSWRTMRQLGTTDEDACAYNDFALVKVATAYVDQVNPSVPFWGGPTKLAPRSPASGRVETWGQSSLRPGTALSPKAGTVVATTQGGWSTTVYTVTPGVPGDSGSGFLDAAGRAFGVLSTVSFAPAPAANGVGSLAKEVAFARAHSGIKGLRLVPGTEPFTG